MDSHKYYGDIIENPRHISKDHKPMDIITRAAQFAPFAALPGHSDTLAETGRLTDEFIILDNEEKERINNILSEIIENFNTINEISVTYFIKDSKKQGGRYETYYGSLKKIDTDNQILILNKDTTKCII